MRPSDLPDFGKPPLNEVVLGVQFSPATGYSQIRAGEVWALFQANYPNVEEYPPLAPAFETFGPQVSARGSQFEFLDGAIHDRFWFLNENRDELIQFQQDRLLHNWRKVGDGSSDYPRFEIMIENFSKELQDFEKYIKNLADQSIQINQCEVSYINHIVFSLEMPGVSDWVKFLQFSEQCPDGLQISFRDTVVRGEGAPLARLICDAAIGTRATDGQRLLALTLTYRGAPKDASINAALDFLNEGRGVIVRRFAEITTEKAHEIWERKK